MPLKKSNKLRIKNTDYTPTTPTSHTASGGQNGTGAGGEASTQPWFLHVNSLKPWSMSLTFNHMVSLVLRLKNNIHRIPLWKVNQCAQMFIFVLRTQYSKNSEEHICLETQDNPTALPALAASPPEMDAERDLGIHSFNPLISQRRRLGSWGEGLLVRSHTAGMWPNGEQGQWFCHYPPQWGISLGYFWLFCFYLSFDIQHYISLRCAA